MKRLILIIIFPLILYGLAFGGNKDVVFISEKELPRKIGIVGPLPFKDKNIELAALGMVKNVIKNYLSGKGYIVVPLKGDVSFSKKMSFKEIKKVFKTNPELDGLVTIGVYQLSSFNVAFAQYYKMDGEICLFTKKKKLGCWRESATRKKLSIASDPLGAIATVVSSVVSSEGNVNIKNIIFDWAFKVSSLIPSFSSAAKKPKILRVITNITKRPFKMGDKVIVGLEGTPGGKAYFDIEPLIKKIPLPEVENGIYKGVYVVKKGDSLEGGIVYVHLENERGEKRDWVETSPLVFIDGIPPKPVEKFSATCEKDFIKLMWNTRDTDVTKFELYRSNNPLSGYVKIAEPVNFSWEDRKVEPGKAYYYRLICLDKVGNKSKASQIGPLSLPVLTKRPLPEVIISDVSSGKYFLNSTATIPFGTSLTIGPNVDIEFQKNATLKVEGNLKLISGFILSNDKNGTKVIQITRTGKLDVKDFQIQGIDGIQVMGTLNAEGLFVSKGHRGIVINTLNRGVLKKSTFRELDEGLHVEDGKVVVEECDFERNKVAINVKRGDIEIIRSNFIENKVNIKSDVALKISKNFLGSKDPLEFKLKGQIDVESFLSSPYPKGKEIFMKDLKTYAKKKKHQAIEYLNKGKYQKAVDIFKEVVKVYSDADTYIYYIYALSMIGDPSIEQVIDEALKKYPFESRIYQIGIRYYLQINKQDKAESLLNKGLKLNPKDPSLLSMKVFFHKIENKK
jgi:tetratricopeptide (TPR) repeat protein